MRKQTIVFVTIAFFALFAAGEASAQGRPVLGGFKEMSKTDAVVLKAARFAASSEAKRTDKEIEFISVIKAERQVVAGTNYRMCLKVNDSGAEGQDEAEVFVKVVVNVDPKGVYKLLSYEASDCGEEEEDG
jgi:cystatin-C